MTRQYNKMEQPRQKFCQGLCDDLKVGRPIGSPYRQGYCFCARCDVWLLMECLKHSDTRGVVCPCCNFRPRMRPRNGFK